MGLILVICLCLCFEFAARFGVLFYVLAIVVVGSLCSLCCLDWAVGVCCRIVVLGFLFSDNFYVWGFPGDLLFGCLIAAFIIGYLW